MIFYILLLIVFVLDYINLHQSQNHKDKKKYIIATALVAAVGILFFKYQDTFQIAPKILEVINFYGGNM